MKIFCKVKEKSSNSNFNMNEPVVIISSSEDEVEDVSTNDISVTKSSQENLGTGNFSQKTPIIKQDQAKLPSQLNTHILMTDLSNRSTNALFKQFYYLCEENILSSDEEGISILNYLKRKHGKTNTLNSNDYRKALDCALKTLSEKKKSVYIAISDVTTVLRKLPAKRKIALVTSPDEEPFVKVPRSNDSSKNTQCDDKAESSTNNGNQENNEKLTRKIKKYETYLKTLNKEIKKLETRELTLDEMGDSNSPYMQKCRLEKRTIQVFKRICQLKQQSESTGRICEKKIRVQSSRYTEINKKVEKFLNSEKELVLQFPDYTDIHELIERTSKKCNLNLSPTEIVNEAQTVFKDVGRNMQKRRVKDFMHEFGDFEDKEFAPDPAESDEQLAKKLTDNKKHLIESTKEIVEKFADIQTNREKSENLSKEESQDLETFTYEEAHEVESSEAENSDVVLIEDDDD